MLWALGVFVTALISMVSFLFGQLYSQTEKVIEQKKAAYEKFLEACPTAQDAYQQSTPEQHQELMSRLSKLIGILSIYAAPDVLTAGGKYFDKLNDAYAEVGPDSPALHPAFVDATRQYNAMIVEMRRDVLAWSFFRMAKKEPVKAELVAQGVLSKSNP